jgi:hypothetical protein
MNKDKIEKKKIVTNSWIGTMNLKILNPNPRLSIRPKAMDLIGFLARILP